MSAQIVDPKRYKKTTRKKSIKNKEEKRKQLKKEEKIKREIFRKRTTKNTSKKNTLDYSYIKLKNNNDKQKITTNKVIRKNINTRIPVIKIAFFLVAIISISVLSKQIVKRYTNDSITTVELDTGEIVNLVQDSYIRVGVSKLDTTDLNKSKNIILNEIYNLTNLKLVDYNSKYEIEYIAAEKVEKVSNKEYLITLNNKYKIDIDDIKNSIEKIKTFGNDNIYYNSVSKISSVEKVDKNIIKLVLSEDLPYYIYNLNFPLFIEKDKQSKYTLMSNLANEIKFTRNNSKSTVKEITLKNYDDSDDMVDDFRENKIDIFIASSESVMSLVGKHDYTLKKYRDGEMLFLFGNKDSKMFSLKEVRKAVLYSIDRDQIIRDLNNNFLEKIDIPYIYSDVKYKHDIYGAQNTLLSQGWNKKRWCIY